MPLLHGSLKLKRETKITRLLFIHVFLLPVLPRAIDLYHTTTTAKQATQTAKNSNANDLASRATTATSCSNHGTLINDVCVCNSSYFGKACESKRCPSDCNNNGVCDPKLGKCTCNKGYSGDNCKTQLGPNPLSGLSSHTKKFGDNLKLDSKPPGEKQKEKKKLLEKLLKKNEQKKCKDDCNSNGSCDNGSCTCFPGYSGDSCGVYCPNDCTGRGHCVAGACLCFSAFRGADCSIRIACSDHGAENDAGQCVCDEGWWGADCSVEAVCQDPTCSTHGECRKGTCHCEAGFSGVLCETPPKECDPACPANGECDRLTGKCMCDGAPCPKEAPNGGAGGGGASSAQDKLEAAAHGGDIAAPAPPGKSCGDNGEYNSAINACDCKAGFHGDRCEIQRCPGFSEEEGVDDCHDQGMCINGKCQCLAGFGMKDGSEPNSCKDKVCPMDCGKHGKCVEGACECEAGWTGIGCREPSCNDCNGRGVCTFVEQYSTTGVKMTAPDCICDEGFAGKECEKTQFEQPKCPADCNGRGMCFDGRCVCKTGFYGEDCGKRNCGLGKLGPNCNLDQCANDCSGKGLCFEGKCSCNKDFAGPDCSIPKICYGACYNSCASGAGSKCEFCKGQCLTLQSNPIIGKHNPMEDLATSLLGISKVET
ncbi:unnamed protein product [Amoebophrya sp. A120]|nr:unnamed protein product [Amoebophrya sp. A120]|eukprot:GSA120T00008763001.1